MDNKPLSKQERGAVDWKARALKAEDALADALHRLQQEYSGTCGDVRVEMIGSKWFGEYTCSRHPSDWVGTQMGPFNSKLAALAALATMADMTTKDANWKPMRLLVIGGTAGL